MPGNSLVAVMAAGLAPRMKAQTLSAVDTRGGGGWLNIIREPWGGAWQRNIEIDAPRDILSFPGVFAPLTLIASDIAKLRIKLVQEDEKGIATEIKTGSPFLPVLRKPNRYQTRIKFIEQWIVSKLLYGNTYALKQRDHRRIVTALYILDAQRVTTLVAENGDVYYKLSTDHLSGLTEGVTVPASEIIHDMMVSLWHPLVGVSPNYGAGKAATMGNRIEANSTKFFDNMSRPSGALTAPGSISDETAGRLKAEWEANFGGDNIGRLAVLGDGLKYEAMTIPAQQAQLIEQLQDAAKQIAACYHVPLFKVGGPIPVGSSIEAMQQVYYNDCLHALIESLELCLDEGLGLIESDYYTEFDLDGLLRMDTAAQVSALKEAVDGALMAPNEARGKLNLKALPGGDTIYMQQQNFSLEALAKRDAQADPFATVPKRATDKLPVPRESDADGDEDETDEIAAELVAAGRSMPQLFATAGAPHG